MKKFKKHIISALLMSILVVSFSTGYAEAAVISRSTSLDTGQKIATSQRVYFSSNQDIIVTAGNYWNSGSPVVLTLSKAGEGSKINIYLDKNSTTNQTIKNVWGSGEFWVVLQCNTSPLNTNCKAGATITNRNG